MKSIITIVLLFIATSLNAQYDYKQVEFPKGQYKSVYGYGLPEVDTTVIVNFTAYVYRGASSKERKLAKKRARQLMRCYRITRPIYIVETSNPEGEDSLGIVRIYYRPKTTKI